MKADQEVTLDFKYLINLSIIIHNSTNNDFWRKLIFTTGVTTPFIVSK